MVIEDVAKHIPADGKVWITNNTRYHNFFNGGEQNRIHIVACMLENRFINLKSIFKKICISSDHAGYAIKEFIKEIIVNSNISITDLGPFEKKSVDYPDYAKKVSSRISKKKK